MATLALDITKQHLIEVDATYRRVLIVKTQTAKAKAAAAGAKAPAADVAIAKDAKCLGNIRTSGDVVDTTARRMDASPRVREGRGAGYCARRAGRGRVAFCRASKSCTRRSTFQDPP